MKKLFTLLVLIIMTLGVSAQSVRGDLNGDGQVNTSDVTELYNIIFGTAVDDTGQSKNLSFTIGDVSFTMVSVSGGTFQMGATSEQVRYADSWESPVHSVTLSDYWIGETEVTQALWQSVMGSNPSYFNGSNRPVEYVSWEDCQEFVNKLNNLLSGQLPAGRQFRLPTEAEWEFAARGGNNATTQTKYAGSDNIDDVAWYEENSYNKGSSHPDYGTHDVATKAPNALGLYDMSGNVFEWCQDWYGTYSINAQTDPTGPSTGSYRINRGGAWFFDARICRVSLRHYHFPSDSLNFFGLRIAL